MFIDSGIFFCSSSPSSWKSLNETGAQRVLKDGIVEKSQIAKIRPIFPDIFEKTNLLYVLSNPFIFCWCNMILVFLAGGSSALKAGKIWSYPASLNYEKYWKKWRNTFIHKYIFLSLWNRQAYFKWQHRHSNTAYKETFDHWCSLIYFY